MDLGIDGKIALITGGGRGIGLASALEMVKEGCNLVIADRNEADLVRVERQIQAMGARVLTVVANLEEADGIDKVISAAFGEFGRVDILFNNAGHLHYCTTINATDAEWESQLNIHLMACVRTCRAVIPKMLERKWGRIINMSSVVGVTPGRGLSGYSAAKAAVISYTRLHRHGVFQEWNLCDGRVSGTCRYQDMGRTDRCTRRQNGQIKTGDIRCLRGRYRHEAIR